MQEIRRLVIRCAREHPGCGYTGIQGALEDLGYRVGRGTVRRILKTGEIKSAPDRPTSWATFLKAHWGQVAAVDFFTTEAWTSRGSVTHSTLFVLDLKSRRVTILGSTLRPGESFLAQMAENLTDAFDGFLLPHRFPIFDRDSTFTERFRQVLGIAGVNTILTPRRAPSCEFAARLVRSITEECLRRMCFFGERSLRRALLEYQAHYNAERPHQGVGNRVLTPRPRPTAGNRIRCEERLGGLLRHYRRMAW